MSSEYPSDWDTRRKEVYRRDEFQCQNCGRMGGSRGNAELHAHHIVPKSNGGSHSKSNLVTVCKDCHNAIHGDTTAPTQTRIKHQKAPGYFDILSEVTGDIAELQRTTAIYSEITSNLISGENIKGSQQKEVEQELLEMAFSLKTDIMASQQIESPERVSPDEEFAFKQVFEIAQEIIQKLISKIEAVQELKQEAIDASQSRNCPSCGSDIDETDKFCSKCGMDISSIGECPDCGTPIDTGDEYCTECGVDVSDIDSGQSFDGVAEIADQVTELANELQVLMKRSTLYALRGTAAVGAVNSSKQIESIGWDYCPNCGFRQGVWIRNNTAECVLCTATWESKGIFSTKWKMTSGQNPGEAHNDNTWDEKGQQKYSQERYEDVFKQTDHEALSQRMPRFS